MPSHVTHEIHSQPELWRRVTRTFDQSAEAQALWRRQRAEWLLFVGCGSSHHGGAIAAAAARRRGLSALALPASVVWLAPDDALPQGGRAYAVAPSRSGSTTEVVSALSQLRRRFEFAALAITCKPGSTPISSAADRDLVLADAAEHGPVQTRAFTALLLAQLLLVADAAGDAGLRARLDVCPAAAETVLKCAGSLADFAAARRWRNAVCLGTGLLKGAAAEAALLFTEMAGLPAHAFDTLELRHGPNVLVSDETLLVHFGARDAVSAEAIQAAETAVITEFKQAARVSIGVEPAASADQRISLPKELGDEGVALVGSLVPQLLALSVAEARGIDPDAPQGIKPHIELP